MEEKGTRQGSEWSRENAGARLRRVLMGGRGKNGLGVTCTNNQGDELKLEPLMTLHFARGDWTNGMCEAKALQQLYSTLDRTETKWSVSVELLLA